MSILPIDIVNVILEMHKEIEDEERERMEAWAEEQEMHRWFQEQNRADFFESYSDDDDWSTHRYFD